jgi:flagellar FliL protein
MAQEPAPGVVEEAPPAKKGGLMSLVKALAIISVIVLAQVCAAAMLLPSAEETRELGKELARAEHGKADHDGEGADHGEEAHGEGHGEHAREVTLGTYHIVSFNPKTGASLSVDFELFGTVLAEEEPEFAHLYEAHQKRISEQITIAIRGLQADDLTDPGLGLIKRTILEKTNRALGKPLVREAIISQFSFVER